MCLGGGKNPQKPSATGSTTPCPAPDPIDKAIAQIRGSDWAKTAEGAKVLGKIEELRKAGKIKYAKLPAGTLGQWNGSEILVPEGATDVDYIASSVLVHEGTHALNEDELPASKTKFTIDALSCWRASDRRARIRGEARSGGGVRWRASRAARGFRRGRA